VPFLDFRVFVRVRVSQTSGLHLMMSRQFALPLLGFHLLMVLTPAGVQGLRSAAAMLGRALVCCQIETHLHYAA
jgi:hypothetical protein